MLINKTFVFWGLSLSLAFLSSQQNLWAVDYISAQDKTRCEIYNSDRDKQKVLPFTKTICDRLTDPQNIDYNRQATVADKEVIFKAMMGTIMVHQTYNFTPLFIPHQTIATAYQTHLSALEVVNQSISLLWKQTLKGIYVHSFTQVDKDLHLMASEKGFNYQELLTTNFIKWFYQSLESYQHELNFFAGTATLEWFQSVSANLRNFADFKDKNLKVISDHNFEQIGIYKALVHTSGRPGARNRQPKVEYTSWLLAKAAGLEKVVNPVLPVRIEGNNLVLDPINYTGTIEPFVGIKIKEDQHQQTLADCSDDLRYLYSRVLNFSDSLAISDRTSTVNLFTPVLWDFEVYFEEYGIPKAKRSFRSAFLRSINHLDKANTFNDIQVFKDAVSVENLLLLMSFWHITSQNDLNTTNIVYPVNPEGEIIPTVIDYDEALGRSERVKQRIPQLYLLEQSNQILTPEQTQKISEISEHRLSQVMMRSQQLPNNPHDQMKAFTDADGKKIIDRLAKLKEAIKYHSTIRSLMHKIVSIPGQSRPKLLQYYEICEKDLKCSVLDPLIKTPHKISGAVEQGKVGGDWYYPLEYVFAASWKTFNEGRNRGNDLKGYKLAPVKEITE